jgi:glutamate synthase (NADPH/NADH) large chain
MHKQTEGDGPGCTSLNLIEPGLLATEAIPAQKRSVIPIPLVSREEKLVELVSDIDPESPINLSDREHDACALMSIINKTGHPTHSSVRRVLDGLIKMSHRAGMVNGEGDGCGIMLDIPRQLWEAKLSNNGQDGGLAYREDFWVGHVMFNRDVDDKAAVQQVKRILEETGVKVLFARPMEICSETLGPLGQVEEPHQWQLAGISQLGGNTNDLDRTLFRAQLQAELNTSVCFSSLSCRTVVYKLRGSPEALEKYFVELNDPRLTSVAVVGHGRYCTNTYTHFFRVQPFPVVAHNGEINTVARLQQEARMLGAQLPFEGSDSQDLDRTIATLINDYGYGLLEAMEIAFPPIVNEIKQLEPDLQNLYVFLRQAFGPFAQGPAGILSRYGNELVFAVDALGLRPLWYGQVDDCHFFSSERGVFSIDELISDPKPLAPGEKIYVRLMGRGEENQIWPYSKVQQEALKRLSERLVIPKDTAKLISFSQPPATLPDDDTAIRLLPESKIEHPDEARTEILMSALGWGGDDLHYLEFLADTGNEPIGSLGYDGPLAALNKERRNLADFYKENVAVVTNPAIDREREIEHFSTRVALGARPSLIGSNGQPRPGSGQLRLGQKSVLPKARPSRMVELSCPILLGGHAGSVAPLPPLFYWEAARSSDTYLLEELVEFVTQNGFRQEAVCIIHSCFHEDEEPSDALRRMIVEAVEGVEHGAKVVLVDDTEALGGDDLWLDPLLVVAALDEGLRNYKSPRREGESHRNLRREASIIMRSGSLRNLHDIIVAYGMGADAVNPYLMIEVAASKAKLESVDEESRQKLIRKRIENLVEGLKKGLEKVISTMGIHELRGYGRLFPSIGLSPEIARYFRTRNYGGSERGGFGWAALRADSEERRHVLQSEKEAKLARDFHLYPKVWKTAGQVAVGQAPFEKYEQQVLQLETEDPISMRHVLDIDFGNAAANELPPVDPQHVDISIERHSLPFAISSMSFGSQGEIAYKAYAEAGDRLNMVTLNGEGGEMKDILGLYYNTRGVQIASGRFGVNIELLNSAHLLEIKVGQGAKPGEGGHLPGSKVTDKVAAARNASRGVDLISPSNNHDIYSIEDLAQFISELKTANPDARVAVKVPVVSGIGTIAVGIAKAGADIITLSGFDGGTGAARAHALKYVGMPSDMGVIETHRALIAAGLRDQVEVWVDGGMKTATDVVKMVLLGANRVGFATLAMVAIGCTICRACQKDTCHVGIATQIESEEEAKHRGLKRFVPQVEERAVQQLVTFFTAMGEEVKKQVARLGFYRLQDLVGRSDLLVQARAFDLVDWTELLKPIPEWVERKKTDAEEQARQPRICMPCAAIPNAAYSGDTTRRITTRVKEMVVSANGHYKDSYFYEEERLGSVDRSVGTHLVGALIRDGYGAGPSFARNMRERGISHLSGVSEQEEPKVGSDEKVQLALNHGSIPGNGLAAFNSRALKVVVQGGAQDGVGKGALGGTIVVMKGLNSFGKRVDGSVGKSFAYGAQRGLFIVQGNADSRFGIRLSGADVIIGGEVTEPVDDSLGYVGARSNMKGFAFEYMTNGRALVLGDPGPWICSGMTGGTVYLRLQPEMGLDLATLKRRLAKGAKVSMSRLNERDKDNIRTLLGHFFRELEASGQSDEVERLSFLGEAPEQHFLKVQPINMQVDPSISTE